LLIRKMIYSMTIYDAIFIILLLIKGIFYQSIA
jgi:hypothetical protein